MPTDTKTNRDERKWIEQNEDGLSDSTKRARWTHEPGEQGERNGQTLATRTREVVEDWARRRNAQPATATRGPDGRPRVLRFDFEGGPDKGGRNLERVSWDEWWSVFEARDLVFIYQESKRDGNEQLLPPRQPPPGRGLIGVPNPNGREFGGQSRRSATPMKVVRA